MKTVAIIDAGGRGAALAHAYAKSPQVDKILVIPGNDLISLNIQKPLVIFPQLKTTFVTEIVQICKKEKVDLVDVAQDNAVAVGLADALLQAGLQVSGPTKAAGELEWNKAFAREFMGRFNIPQPDFFIFDDLEKAFAFLDREPDQPWFVKASGLCEGKGALPAKNNIEAKGRIVELQKFGEAGKTFLLEKWLKSDGEMAEEFSAFAVCDGGTFQMIGYAQDHKRALDGDKGENTGGMGCSTLPLVVDDDIRQQVKDIFKKTFDGMKQEGRPYKGVLYLGGIIINSVIPSERQRVEESIGMTKPKVYVIEYNARWGDPEAEVIIPGIITDFYDLGLAIATGNLDTITLETDGKARVSVALCAKGYPQDYTNIKGKKVMGIDVVAKMPDVIIYGAGIKKVDGNFVVNGGRVLHVVGKGKNVVEARESAYKAINKLTIEGDNQHFRKDIGWRDVKRLTK